MPLQEGKSPQEMPPPSPGGITHGHTVLIGLGSRDGDRERSVSDSLAWLRTVLSDVIDSGLYMTKPLSGTGRDYCNAVARGVYYGEPQLLAESLKEYERFAGRTSEHVTIDLDLVCVDGTVLRPRDYAAPYFTIGLTRLTHP